MKYTYEDLCNSPIGTKITFKYGCQYIKTSSNKFKDVNEGFRDIYMGNIVGLNEPIIINHNDYGEIIKIEESTYTTVYEQPKEILTVEEKEYLRNIIKYGNYNNDGNGYIKYIKKYGYLLNIMFDDMSGNEIYIDKRKYFKGLQEDRKYTLEELGL